MNNEARYFSDFAENTQTDDSLWQYVQSLSPEMIAQMSQPQSTDVQQVMERNITGLLGSLAGEGIDVSVTLNRRNLAQLLGSAMMSGYFLRNAEQRLAMEQSLLNQDLNLPE